MKWFLILLVVAMFSNACAGTKPSAAPTTANMPSNTSLPPSITPTPTKQPKPSPTPAGDIFERSYRLGRGVNLGNALEAPQEGEWGVTLEQDYFDLIQEAGFNSVRVPIRWSAHAEESAPYRIDPAFFDRIDWVVENAFSRNLAAVINIHHYDAIYADPAGQQARFLAIWDQIASHYQDFPDDLYFEILNEPNGKLSGETWNQLVSEALGIIRKTNPNRAVIIGPDNWNSVLNINTLQLPEQDQHIIVSFHYYLPFPFTHQGAEWVNGSDAWLGTSWAGNHADQLSIKSDFQIAFSWSKTHHRPIYLGEFGAYSKANLEDRSRWTSYVSRLAEEYGFSWAYWEFCAGFGVYDPIQKTWIEALKTALIPGE